MSSLITVPDSEAGNNAVLAASNASGAFLGRIKLCQGDADEVAQGKIDRGGNFAFNEAEGGIVDLGPTFRCVICAGRAKAIQFGETVRVSFDPTSEEFQRMAANSGFGTNCMTGPEYLLYLPDLNKFCLLFCYNKTLQAVNDDIFALMHNGAEFSSYYFKGSKNSWFKTKVNPCEGIEIADETAFLDKIKAFRNEAENHTEPERAPTTGRDV